MHSEQRKIQVNGMQMNVLLAGQDNSGPYVLLVHGYPDTHHIWRKQIPELVKAGYRVIAPDTRGCGQTDITPRREDYRVDNLVADLIALLDALQIDKVRLVAHDWGSGICWPLIIKHPERVDRYVALSTGHPMAYRRGGLDQKLKGYYTMVFQLPWLPEFFLSACNWLGMRLMTNFPEEQPQWQKELSRPGRLKAGLNYYRANPWLFIRGHDDNTRVPVMGVWSSGDRFLAEGQMRDSAHYVDAPFRYECIDGANHWLQLSGADRFNPILLDYLQADLQGATK